MSKSGTIRYYEVFYQDLDDTIDTPKVLKRFVQKWIKYYRSEHIHDIVAKRVHAAGYVKFSSLLFTYNKKHYRLLPVHLELKAEQYFDAFLYELRRDLISLNAENIISTAMID